MRRTCCPNDPEFDHDDWYNCVPRDFSPISGRSPTHQQHRGTDGRWRWDGGCDAAPATPLRPHPGILEHEVETDGDAE